MTLKYSKYALALLILLPLVSAKKIPRDLKKEVKNAVREQCGISNDIAFKFDKSRAGKCEFKLKLHQRDENETKGRGRKVATVKVGCDGKERLQIRCSSCDPSNENYCGEGHYCDRRGSGSTKMCTPFQLAGQECSLNPNLLKRCGPMAKCMYSNEDSEASNNMGTCESIYLSEGEECGQNARSTKSCGPSLKCMTPENAEVGTCQMACKTSTQCSEGYVCSFEENVRFGQCTESR